MSEQEIHTFAIDSSQRISGTYNNFVIQLNPPLKASKRNELLFANIPNPTTGTIPPYYCISIPELGLSARTASYVSASTYIVPTTLGNGFIIIHEACSDFEEK